MISLQDLYTIYRSSPNIQRDSRKIKKGDLFWALKGDNFNGNTFALQALLDGAAYAVIDDKKLQEQHPAKNLLLVEDTLQSLQQLALYHRQQFHIPFIAITGSNGKTTSKELIYAVLNTTYKTSATKGNLNNHIGIPLTLLSIPLDSEMAIIEMGANHQGEIADYCKYVLPNYGIITNCGKAHIGYFGGEEGVRKAKGELFEFLKTTTHAHAFVCEDYDYLRRMSQGIPHIIFYGSQASAPLRAEVLSNTPLLNLRITQAQQSFALQSQLVGEYNLMNLLCAVAVGLHFNVAIPKIIQSLEAYTPSNSRSQWIEHQNNNIILDAYNANPTSMELAIKNFASLQANTKIIFLGEMKELGDKSLEEHQQIITLLQQYQWKHVVLVGKDFMQCSHPYLCFENSTLAKEWFQQQHISQATILIKGSRATQMENIIAP